MILRLPPQFGQCCRSRSNTRLSTVAALDVSIRAQVIELLKELQRDLGVAYLFISHDMAVVERMSHRVAVMYMD